MKKQDDKKRSIVFKDCALPIGDFKKITILGEYGMNERFPEFLESAKKNPSTHYDPKVPIWMRHIKAKPVSIELDGNQRLTVSRGQ